MFRGRPIVILSLIQNQLELYSAGAAGLCVGEMVPELFN